MENQEEIFDLNKNNLSKIALSIPTPKYSLEKVSSNIVHVGIGGFHRAHLACYTNKYLQNEENCNWGICGIALLKFDRKIYDVLKEQNGLYTLMVKTLDGKIEPEIIGAIVECVFAPNNPKLVIDKMADEETKIITLTITEGGYNFNDATGEFIIDNPQIQHDIKNPLTPKTIFGYLTASIKKRKQKNLPLTIQSCDNILGNGKVMKKMLLSYMNEASPNLVDWTIQNISFPNSMVDRITPGTTEKNIEELKSHFAINDRWPVVCEPYTQWVIEDNFKAGRPKWELVGAQFVKDVTPYEKMKLSLLNAGHSVLGLLGALVGYQSIDEVAHDSQIASFLRVFMDKEVTPVLDPLEGIDLDDYKSTLIKRFGNQNIKDTVSRICSESSAKIPKFLLPTLNKQIATHCNFSCTAYVLAAWGLYSKGVNEKGEDIKIIDVCKHELRKKADEGAKSFIKIDSIFGKLSKNSNFVEVYLDAYNKIKSEGVKNSVDTFKT